MFDGIRDRVGRAVRARPWLDHVIRAGGRYQRQRGDYYAAGITYFTVLALFPLLMVAFSVAGFILVNNPHLLNQLQNKIIQNIPGSFGSQLTDLVHQAIQSRTGVGVIGLAGAFYAGLGWMANLRAALTEQWEQQAPQGNWFRTKLSDIIALIGLGAAMAVSLGLSALAGSSLGYDLLKVVHLQHAWGVGVALTVASVVLAVLATWAVFVWVIARLPRRPVTMVSAAKAAFIAAIAFEIWKQVASFYLHKVLTSPAGVTFGPIIGLLIFAYFTARIILFATAWAATAAENEIAADIPVPPPAVIEPRMVREQPTGRGVAWFGAGAAVAAVIAGVWRRK